MMSLLWHFLCIFCTVSNYNWANILNICRNRGRQSIFLPPKKTSTFIECKTWRGLQRKKLNWPHNGRDNENDTSPRKSPFPHWVEISLGPKCSLPKSFRALCSSFWCWVKKCLPGSWFLCLWLQWRLFIIILVPGWICFRYCRRIQDDNGKEMGVR